ncbi:MAG: DCC1-like thiol-disulfide oxidoreductase family protein [Oceanipulchritudo sp.]
MEAGRILVFYDGKCPFCLRWVARLLSLDRLDRLRFASLQSGWTRAFLEKRGLAHPGTGSILVWDNEVLRCNSEALLRIVQELPRPWRYLRHLRFLPSLLRDGLYQFIGKRRYAWYGRYDGCRVPHLADRRKFLDLDDPVYQDEDHADPSRNTADPDPR